MELSTVIIITSQSIHHSPQQWNLGKSSRPIWKTPSLSGGTSSFATNHWRSFSNRTFLQSLPPSLIYPSISLFTFSNNPLRHNFLVALEFPTLIHITRSWMLRIWHFFEIEWGLLFRQPQYLFLLLLLVLLLATENNETCFCLDWLESFSSSFYFF